MTTTAQHTPGPWRMDHEAIISVPYGVAVAYLADVRGDGARPPIVEWPGDDIPEVESNARLIAAAPDLLEAAKDMLAAIQRLRLCPKCKEQECDCWAKAAAAIAKAEGKETTP